MFSNLPATPLFPPPHLSAAQALTQAQIATELAQGWQALAEQQYTTAKRHFRAVIHLEHEHGRENALAITGVFNAYYQEGVQLLNRAQYPQAKEYLARAMLMNPHAEQIAFFDWCAQNQRQPDGPSRQAYEALETAQILLAQALTPATAPRQAPSLLPTEPKPKHKPKHGKKTHQGCQSAGQNVKTSSKDRRPKSPRQTHRSPRLKTPIEGTDSNQEMQ